MRNMYNVIGMIILVVSAALGIVFTVATVSYTHLTLPTTARV